MRIYLTSFLFIIIYHSAISQQIVTDQGKPLYVRIGEEPSSIKVTWFEPAPATEEIITSLYTVKIGINSTNPVAGISLLLNGSPFSDKRGLIVVKPDSTSFDQLYEKQIVLKSGLNTLEILVTDKKGFAIMETREIKLVIPELLRTDYALLFATDHYDQWNALVNPINDANAIAEELKNNFGFEVELVTNATQDSMMRKLKQYADKSYMDNDQLFVFFAGHGQFDESFKEGYLVCKDSKLNDAGKISYLSHSNLRSIINNIPVKHIFLVMDACFGGAIDPLLAMQGYRGEEYDAEMSNAEFIVNKLKFTTRKYLTSGGREYVPDGIPGHHSPFARRFLEALRSYGGRDKVLTIPEVYSYVENLQPVPRAGEFGRNEPGSDFIFVYKE
ncbi:MAG TPA: caspase family protein [Cyclobacteriaceae bacterium]|nr:caspase family protein [Cyclobacteriaceae bacterium]